MAIESAKRSWETHVGSCEVVGLAKSRHGGVMKQTLEQAAGNSISLQVSELIFKLNLNRSRVAICPFFRISFIS